MKKTLLIAALSMVSASAFASKARLNALGNADHLHDVQRTFDRPYEAAMFGEYATVEFGSNSAPSATNQTTAEGGFVRQWGDNNYLGLYVGHQPGVLADPTTGLIALAYATNNTTVGGLTNTGGATVVDLNTWYSTLRNPLNLWWAMKAGDITWGVNAFYENSSQNTPAIIQDGTGTPVTTPNVTNRHATVGGVSLGAAGSSWDVDATIGLTGKAEYSNLLGDNNRVLKANSNYQVHGAWRMDTLDIYARYGMASASAQFPGLADAKTDATAYGVGIIDSRKKDGVEFFYGAELAMTSVKTGLSNGAGDLKIDGAAVPVVVGVEADATSWMVLRGSIRHNLWSSQKTSLPGRDGITDTVASTVAAAGTGFKFGKFNLDTYLAASANGNVSLATDGTTGDRFLTQASLTYTF